MHIHYAYVIYLPIHWTIILYFGDHWINFIGSPSEQERLRFILQFRRAGYSTTTNLPCQILDLLVDSPRIRRGFAFCLNILDVSNLTTIGYRICLPIVVDKTNFGNLPKFSIWTLTCGDSPGRTPGFVGFSKTSKQTNRRSRRFKIIRIFQNC